MDSLINLADTLHKVHSAVPWGLTFLLAFVFSIVFTAASIWAARRFDFLARPNSRSSHSVPTPRIGGVGICAAFLATMVISQIFFRNHGMYPHLWFFGLVLGGVWAAVGGFLDDVLEFRPAWKLLFQLVPLALVFIFDVTLKSVVLPFVGEVVLPGWLSVVGTVVVVIGLMNVYNFMDGMDGNAALFAMIVLIGLLALSLAIDAWALRVEVLAIAALVGAVCGFYQFNKPGIKQWRKTFMGDSGSQFVGFALAVLILHGNEANERTPFVGSFILVSPFVFDVVYTLAHRLWRRVNVFRGHREHLYQRLLICNGEDHAKTVRFACGQFLVALIAGMFYSVFSWATTVFRLPAELQTKLYWVMCAMFAVATLSLVADVFYVKRREKQLLSVKQ